ncbi:MAG: hypothetical protein AB8G77_02215 [Rhodothermales bacterium]
MQNKQTPLKFRNNVTHPAWRKYTRYVINLTLMKLRLVRSFFPSVLLHNAKVHVVLKSVLSTIFFVGWFATPAFSQSNSIVADSLRNPYGSGIGFSVVVTNSGFGLGGYFAHAIDTRNSFLAELNIGSEKSEREVKFFGLGRSFIPDKANYFARMPIHIGVRRRLWEEFIEDNFRPYFQFTGGPTLGWVYPYFDDANNNGTYDTTEKTYDGLGSIFRGDFRFGLGGTIGIGANFGENGRLTQGVRIAYSFNYFFESVQLLELDDQFSPTKFFGTPTISITFGKLF